MGGRPILALLVVAAVIAAAILVIASRGRLEPLVALPEPTRPAVAVDPAEPPLNLEGLQTRVTESGNEARVRRNEIVLTLRAALERQDLALAGQREVEDLELSLWVARGRTREIDEQAMHAGLAELVGREYERLAQMSAAGTAGPDSLAKALLYLERERRLAGLPPSPHAGDRDYPDLRQTYLRGVRERHEHLLRQGLKSDEVLRAEYEVLEREFPAP